MASDETPEPKTIKFDYIKSNHFRVVHADGAFGGVVPGGDAINVSFYSERAPIPTQIVHRIGEDGQIGKEVDRVQRDAIVREMEVAIVLDLPTALTLKLWLGDKIKDLRKKVALRQEIATKLRSEGNKDTE